MLKDTKGLFLMFGGVILFLLILGLITKTQKGEKTVLSPYISSIHLGPVVATPNPGLNNLKPITVGKTAIMVQFADTEANRQRGLSGIMNMPADQGMLFVFANKQTMPSFWMKDMKIPLDFIWISNGRVAEIFPNVPAPADKTPDNQLKIYTPSEPIDYVLEVNAGFSEKNLIKVGDAVNLNL
jgi:uncharacterized protein